MWYNEIDGQTCVPCSVKIISEGDNLNENISADGNCCERDGGVLVSYASDGDKSCFFFGQGRAEYVRAGSQNIRMKFGQGKTTRCEIGYGNMKGFFEVFTDKLEILSGKGGHRVRLTYKSGGEVTQLSFTVLYK